MAEFTPFPHFATDAIHAGQEPEQWMSHAVVPPISMATTFKQYAPGEHRGYEYGRSGNPTRDVVEKCIASLEKGKFCMVFASGLSATATITHLLNGGDHIVSVQDVYGGTNRYFSQVASAFHVGVTYVDAATDVKHITDAITDKTRMVWIETPTNPTLCLVDIKAVAAEVKKHKNIFMVVDNTFMTPYFQRPLELGADVVLHSLTKYMNGHSDSIMGALVTNSDAIEDKLRFLQNAIGAIPSPFDCYLVNRGLKTLHLRMQCHMKNGLAVARYLEKDPRVLKVIHPGLESHPQYQLAKTQCRGYSGMCSFYVKGGLKEATTFLSSLKVFILAESLGGFESLAEHPAIMTHASVPKDQRDTLGIGDNLIRLSVGLEDEEDLIGDIDQALTAAMAAAKEQ